MLPDQFGPLIPRTNSQKEQMALDKRKLITKLSCIVLVGSTVASLFAGIIGATISAIFFDDPWVILIFGLIGLFVGIVLSAVKLYK